MLTTLKLTLEYDGTRYQGFSAKKKTACIEYRLSNTLLELTGQSTLLFPAVKTEPGMHADCQIVSFQMNQVNLPTNLHSFKEKLNASLPADIAVQSIEVAEERFVASLAMRSCTYTCRIAFDEKDLLFCRPYACIIPAKPDTNVMKKAAKHLIGTHDFAAFSDGRSKKSTIRTVENIEITEENHLLCIRITANSFLRHMPQLLVGTLLAAGTGECKTDEIPLIFTGEKSAGPACPSYAFTLSDVQFR